MRVRLSAPERAPFPAWSRLVLRGTGKGVRVGGIQGQEVPASAGPGYVCPLQLQARSSAGVGFLGVRVCVVLTVCKT